tara:strand:- start:382 stop:612 length:231 start_codon:yes stop_codon:yes gene_type:complete
MPPFNLSKGNKKIRIGMLKAYLPIKKSIIARRIPAVKIKYLILFAIFLLLALTKKFNKRYTITINIPMSKNEFITI